MTRPTVKTRLHEVITASPQGLSAADLERITGYKSANFALALRELNKGGHVAQRPERRDGDKRVKPYYYPASPEECVAIIPDTAQAPAPLASALDTLLDTMIDTLFDMAKQRLEARLATRLPELAARINTPLIDAPKVEPRVKLPVVAVVGLNPVQEKTVQEAFGSKLDLRFPARENSVSLKHAAQSSERVFMMTKFVKHTVQTMLKNNGAALTLVNGGVTDLVRVMTGFVNEKEGTK